MSSQHKSIDDSLTGVGGTRWQALRVHTKSLINVPIAAWWAVRCALAEDQYTEGRPDRTLLVFKKYAESGVHGDRVQFVIGLCELACGHLEDGLSAWALVLRANPLFQPVHRFVGAIATTFGIEPPISSEGTVRHLMQLLRTATLTTSRPVRNRHSSASAFARVQWTLTIIDTAGRSFTATFTGSITELILENQRYQCAPI